MLKAGLDVRCESTAILLGLFKVLGLLIWLLQEVTSHASETLHMSEFHAFLYSSTGTAMHLVRSELEAQ